MPTDKAVIKNDIRWVNLEVIQSLVGLRDDQINRSAIPMCWFQWDVLNTIKTGN